MIGVDTNVLVRCLIDDKKSSAQVAKARDLVAKQSTVFISTTVLIETIWVLSSAYKVNKASQLTLLQHLLENDAFQLQNHSDTSKAITLYSKYNIGFSDCMICVSTLHHTNTMYTLDKKFAKLPNIKEL